METAQTADYALRTVIELCDSDGRTVTELASSLGVSRSVMQRIVSTLHQRAAVTRDESGRYWPGPFFIALAANVPSELATVAQPVVERLASLTQETVIAVERDQSDSVVIAQATGTTGPLRVEYHTGYRQSLSQGASSLAILAHLEESEQIRLGSGGHSKTAGIRQKGYAYSEGQVREDMVGIAAPILTNARVHGSLAIVLPTVRASRTDELLPFLTAAAQEISSALSSNTPGRHERSPHQ